MTNSAMKSSAAADTISLLLSGLDFDQPVAKVTLNWYGKTYEMQNDSAKPVFSALHRAGRCMPDDDDECIILGNVPFLHENRRGDSKPV